MSIQIIDGFQVNTALPIDNRIVASGSNERDAIPYKYEGLRVFDTSDGLAYVWMNHTWNNENASGVNGTSTTINYIPKFAASNVVGNSIIYQSTTGNIGINTTTPIYRFVVNGDISVIGTGNKFIGNGSGLTDINADNISTGNLTLARMTNGTPGNVLVGGTTNPIYINANQLTTGTSSYSTTSGSSGLSGTASSSRSSVIFTTTTANSIHYLLFSSTSGSTNGSTSSVRAHSGDLYYNPNFKTLTKNGGSLVLQYCGATVHTANALGTSVGNIVEFSKYFTDSGNDNYIEINSARNTSGSGWINISNRLQSRVDSQYMGYIQFNGGNETGVSFGTGYMGSDNYTNAYEKMRIDIAGKVMIGSGTQSSLSAGCLLHLKSNTSLYDGIVHRAINNTNWIFEFQNTSGTARGCIAGNGTSNVVYNTSSDKRLKTNIQDMPSMYDKIRELKPSKFIWTEDSKEDFGFIAQDVFKVIPSLKGEISDSHCDVNSPDFDMENPKRKDGTDYYYSLDYGRFTPYLTKALQETIDKLENLVTKIKTAKSLDDLKSSL